MTIEAPRNTGPTQREQEPSPKKTAFLFPGQGLSPTELIGFYESLKTQNPIRVAERFDLAQDAINDAFGMRGFDLATILENSDSPDHASTAFAQPVIFMLSELALRRRQETTETNDAPAFVAGHSLGQLAAGVAAGILSYEQGVQIAAHRGYFMQDASNTTPSKHVSIFGLREEAVQELCGETGNEIALINAPDLIVVGTGADDVEDVITLAKQKGAKIAQPLPTAGAFHTRFMTVAAKRLSYHLKEYYFKDPQVPIIANSTAEPVLTGEEFKSELVKTMTAPVQWAKSLDTMKRAGIERFVEVGPGSSLSKLNTRNGIPRNQIENVA